MEKQILIDLDSLTMQPLEILDLLQIFSKYTSHDIHAESRFRFIVEILPRPLAKSLDTRSASR